MKLSPRLLAQYPEEMTVILQHQFWDLVVTEDRFEVGLSFGGVPERLVVPFSCDQELLRPVGAVRPAIRARRCGNRGAGGQPAGGSRRPPPCRFRRRPPRAEDEPAKPSEGAEVVRLDRFRKK